MPDRFYEVPVETVAPGMLIDDERWPHVMLVGHVVVGPKWMTARAHHPETNIFPKTAYRVRRGGTVRVERSSLPVDYFGADYVCARCGNRHGKGAYGPGYAKHCPDCGSSDVTLTDEARARIGGRTFKTQSARDAQAAIVAGVTIDESYCDYLDKAEQENHDYYLGRGDSASAELMLTRTLSEALVGNDGD